MLKFKRLVVFFVLLSLVSSALLFAGGKSEPAPAAAAKKTYDLTFASVTGSVYLYPVYVAREKGWFKDAGLNLKELTFASGPVMVEALASNGWDLGISGIGGILPGAITHGAALLAPINTDDGTQMLFVRNNSPILTAGTGKNSLDSRIYGDAASWKGKKVLCNTGAVLQYFLIRVLGGFNLTPNDVQFMAMDVATAGSAFRAGEGDVVAMTGSSGTMAMLADKNFTAVAKGPWVDTGLIGAAYANKNSMANSERREAMKIFFKVYYDTIDWIFQQKNYEEVIKMMIDFSDESGLPMNRESSEFYLKIDTFYSLQDAIKMMTTKAPGKDYSVMEAKLLGVLQFFIDTGSRKPDDAQQLLGHVDASVLQEVLAKK